MSVVLSGDSSPVVRPDALKTAHVTARGDLQAGCPPAPQTRCLCHASANAGNERSIRQRVPEIVDLHRRTRSTGRSPHPTFPEHAGAHFSSAR